VKRALGQMDTIVRTLEEGRPWSEIVSQLSAVSKVALTAAFIIVLERSAYWTRIRLCAHVDREDDD